MTLFTLPFTHPLEFFIALLIGGSFVALFQRSAMSAERRETSWVRRYITGPNGKFFWGATWLMWAVVFGVLLGTFTDRSAASAYGSVGIVALFSGVFVMMGFIWATIGE
jgi:hypothetical protein